MLVELGPVSSAEVLWWTRFARRVVAEVRTDPCDLDGIATDDLLFHWSRLIDEWESVAGRGEQFRWSIRLDCELAEYLLHGMERFLLSPGVAARVTPRESATQRSFSLHVVRAFVDGLEGEGRTHAHYAAQVRATFSRSLN